MFFNDNTKTNGQDVNKSKAMNIAAAAVCCCCCCRLQTLMKSVVRS